ncbi:cytochrome P450 [Streptacidiphilus sp. MAP5-52]|uniref:cytochrome P450 n=1 Tax=Streptacidiphilus sp. MAP5-52 TaxID=3156267 RepID=UPI003514048E
MTVHDTRIPARAPLYGPAFDSDPHATYRMLRQFGPIAPVQLAPGFDGCPQGITGWLVLDYDVALHLLRDPQTWSKDPRGWESTLPADNPLQPMLGHRPNTLFTDGPEHARLRAVVTDSLALIDTGRLRTDVQQLADQLIAQFSRDGHADLIAQYTRPLPGLVFNNLFGGEQYGPDLVNALGGMLDADPQRAVAAGAAFFQYVTTIVTTKQNRRGPDLASWYMDHPHALTQEEVTHQVVLTLGAALEPLSASIGNAISRALADRQRYTDLTNGTVAARTAVEEVLRSEPPMANYGCHYARHPVQFYGAPIHPAEPVLISYAAINAELPTTEGSGGAHLAWSAGPHACPARQPAMLLAVTAVERLLNALGDLDLAVPREQLTWRPGLFQRSLAALPVRFSPLH